MSEEIIGSARTSRRFFLGAAGTTAGAAAVAAVLAPTVASAAPRAQSEAQADGITVGSGETLVIKKITRTNYLKIEKGATLTAPSGYSLTLTVNGVETGQKLVATDEEVEKVGSYTEFVTDVEYRGDIVLTPALSNDVSWQGLDFPIRQAVYVGSSGVASAYSVTSAVRGSVAKHSASGISIASTGACFDGVYVNDGTFELSDARIDLDGPGRCDFIGYGAAAVATGTGGRLVLDGVSIRNRGVVRTGVISDDGATVVVKNSYIECLSGPLPSGYEDTIDLEYMEDCPWMLGIKGDVRATNLLGNNSIAAYINSTVIAQDWGVLSTDSGSDCTMVAVNTDVRTTGNTGGYGSYLIGNATEHFLGMHYDVGTYACINTGGTAYYGDSTHAAIAAFNESLDLGLTDREIAAITPRSTVINSKRWAFMWHGAGEIHIGGGTIVNSELATFLNKEQQIVTTVDGSEGAQLNPANGIILQLMENDDPGPGLEDGIPVNNAVYTCPTGVPSRYSDWSVSTVHDDSDSVSYFTDIALKGDFYNGVRGGSAMDPGQNMVLNFDQTTVDGVISATVVTHYVSEIDTDDYLQLGVVKNEAYEVINNGVIVSLANSSVWTVTGTSYLSVLTLDSSSSVAAPSGKTVTMTVGGTTTTIKAGETYTGEITLTVA
ncbi:MAG: hypothetical protein ABSA93_09250 [Streptosporangiaceae bacterium]